MNAGLRSLRSLWAIASPWLSPIPEKDRRAFHIDLVSAVAYGLFMGFQMPFLPVLLKRLGASPLELGLAVAAPYLSFVVAFPCYRFLRGFRALDINAIPTFFSRLGIASIGWLATPRSILIVFLISQLLEGLGMAAYIRLLRSMYSDVGRSRALGLVRAGLSVAMIVGLVNLVISKQIYRQDMVVAVVIEGAELLLTVMYLAAFFRVVSIIT